MLLSNSTFDRIREIATSLNLRCTIIGYIGATPTNIVTFFARCPHNRAGFYIDVTEEFDVVGIRPIRYVTGNWASSFEVWLHWNGRTVKRMMSITKTN